LTLAALDTYADFAADFPSHVKKFKEIFDSTDPHRFERICVHIFLVRKKLVFVFLCSFVTYAKEIALSSALVFSRITQEVINRFSQSSMERRHQGDKKKRLDFVGNPDYLALGLGSGVGGGTVR